MTRNKSIQKKYPISQGNGFPLAMAQKISPFCVWRTTKKAILTLKSKRDIRPLLVGHIKKGINMKIKINKETDNLLKDKEAFNLMFKIAYYQKRDDSFSIPDLEIGETFLTNEIVDMNISAYRRTKAKLSKWGFCEFRTTTKGTIARITTDKFFEV